MENSKDSLATARRPAGRTYGNGLRANPDNSLLAEMPGLRMWRDRLQGPRHVPQKERTKMMTIRTMDDIIPVLHKVERIFRKVDPEVSLALVAGWLSQPTHALPHQMTPLVFMAWGGDTDEVYTLARQAAAPLR
jgi:hypothetical protein